MRPETANYTREVDDLGDLITVDEYLQSVKSGGFIDYDGMGLPVKDGKAADLGFLTYISPSQGIEAIPMDATHILWFNK